MRNAPYKSTRNSNESCKENGIERMKFQKTGVEYRGHSQNWMKKTGQLNIGDHCNGNGRYMARSF